MRRSFRRRLFLAALAVAVAPTVTVAAVTWVVARALPADPATALSLAAVADGLLLLAVLALAWRAAQALAAPIDRLREGAALLRTTGARQSLTAMDDHDLAEIAAHLLALADRAETAERRAAEQRAAPDLGALLADEEAVGRQALELLGSGSLLVSPTLSPDGPSAATPLADVTFVVLDLETTGLEPDRGDRIVSIGAVRVRGGRVDRADRFTALVDPERPIPPSARRVHGIDDATVRGQPRLEAVLPALVEYVGTSVLVGHVISFDLAFLGPALRAAGLPALDRHGALDTLLLVHALLPTTVGQAARSEPGRAPTLSALDDVAALLGVEVVGRHTALGDALTTAEVFARLLAVMEQRGIRHLGDALALQSPSLARRLLAALLARR